MVLVFIRYGSVAAPLLAVAAEILAWPFGLKSLQVLPILLGALLFYLSEYGMHRFAFHAAPLSWPPARKLQHRLHYDHHVEPNRLDLLFLPIWFLVPNLALAAALVALALGSEAALPALLGMMLAILHYEWLQYVAHIPCQSRTRAGRCGPGANEKSATTRSPFMNDTAMPYRHTQRGTWIVISCLAFAAFDAAIAWRTGQWIPVVVLAVLVAVSILFSSLTVEVNASELRWHFGPGLWAYRLSLGEIESVAVVRNRWWNGWGIRAASGFRLYNVSGLDAVELRLKSGDVQRIGTDDPQGLAAALKARAGTEAHRRAPEAP
jgi:hypothetical protein